MTIRERPTPKQILAAIVLDVESQLSLALHMSLRGLCLGFCSLRHFVKTILWKHYSNFCDFPGFLGKRKVYTFN